MGDIRAILHLLLIFAIFAPLVGAAMIAALADAGREVVRAVALVTALVTLALAATVVACYEPSPPPADVFAVTDVSWLQSLETPDKGLNLKFSLGLDGLSVWFFGLSALLMVTSVLVSWEAVRDRPRGFYAALLVLEMGLL